MCIGVPEEAAGICRWLHEPPDGPETGLGECACIAGGFAASVRGCRLLR